MFLISSYGAPLAQRASYLALYSSLFGPDGAGNYDYIVTDSINSLLIVSMAHTLTIVEPIWPMLQNLCCLDTHHNFFELFLVKY